jgi:hypothetical protein
MDFVIQVIPRIGSSQKTCYGLVELIIESKIIFTFWGHDILLRVMTLKLYIF